MDSTYKIFLKRAQNELNLSTIIIKISNDKEMQLASFNLSPDTYYNATISHAYYSIFYSAKAYLLLKEIKTEAPEEHKKTIDEFSKLVEQGIIDVELLKIYQNALTKADTLLNIFQLEKRKRSQFTYKKIAQTNQEPAQESVHHAQFFLRNIFELCEKVTTEKESP